VGGVWLRLGAAFRVPVDRALSCMSPAHNARILLRIAEKQANPREYLSALMESKFLASSAQGGAQITGTTVNGKSLTLSPIKGMSDADISHAASIALDFLERGLRHIPSVTYPLQRNF
jgi:hypothetical protein